MFYEKQFFVANLYKNEVEIRLVRYPDKIGPVSQVSENVRVELPLADPISCSTY